ncbi:hypothetical protein ACFX13_029211 [Malus domestica]
MSSVETAIALTSATATIRLSRSLSDFINEIKAYQDVLFDLVLELLQLSIVQQLHQKRFDLIRSLNLFE